MTGRMMTVCASCGNLHTLGTKPCKAPRERKRSTVPNLLRNTYKWRAKSEQIRERDRYLCQVCLTGEHGTVQRYTYVGLSVHHIIPLAEDPGRCFDDDNLITVCNHHHKLAESGRIPRQKLVELVASTPPPLGRPLSRSNSDHTPPSISA